MGKNRLDQNWQAEDFLELNANKLLYEVKEDLSIYDLPLQINKAQLEELFRKTLIPEVEETEAPENTRGWVKVKKDGTGKYVAMKNLHFYLLDFLESVLGLVQTAPEYRIILGTLFFSSSIHVWGRKTKDIIHISTHGGYCEPDDVAKGIFRGTPLVYSFLKLAGYEDWANGARDKSYGNGAATGDDFLFMDLSKTKLVVLSACASGKGYLHGLDAIHGMRWAISAAGAWNSVTTLWEVSDEATAVLMLLFYRNLRVMPVSESLYQAKMQLQTITMDELNSDKELKQIVEAAQSGRMTKEQYRKSERNCPFSHWKYWAGFVCYHR